MSSNKTLNRYGLLAVDEITYGTFVAPVVTDGILPIEIPDVDFPYIHDGSRGRSPTGGMLSSVGLTGRGASLDFDTHMILPGVAYAVLVEGNLGRMLRYSGFQATTDFTVSAEKYTYDPENGGFDSGSFRVHREGEQWDIAGGYGSFSIAAEGPVVPVWSFSVLGRGNALPTDVTLPAITYINGSREPPKATNISLVIGAYTTAVVRGFEFSLNRDMSPRADDNAAGHAGFTPGTIDDPRLVVTVEADALATFNPKSIAELGTTQAVSLVIGTAQYDRWKLNMTTSELVEVRKADDGPTALWELEFIGKVSAPGQQDQVQFVTD